MIPIYRLAERLLEGMDSCGPAEKESLPGYTEIMRKTAKPAGPQQGPDFGQMTGNNTGAQDSSGPSTQSALERTSFKKGVPHKKTPPHGRADYGVPKVIKSKSTPDTFIK